MARFTLPRDLYHGKGALENLKTLTGKKAIVVVGGGSMKRNGFLDKAVNYLKEAGMEVQLFENVEPDPSVETVMKGADAMKAFQPDWIVAMGGGSPIDAAKAMWAFYEYPQTSFEDLITPFNFPTLRTKAKFCAIPSTSGTATEVTAFSVITDYSKGIKYPLADFNITPDVAIVDPDLVMSLPKSVTADTGMDVLTHALEAYVSNMASDYTDGLAEKAVELVMNNLEEAYNNGSNKLAREKMHNASTIAGMAFTNAFLGVSHSIAHKIGAEFHLPHGRINAILLPYVVKYNGTKPSKFVSFPKYEYYIADEKYSQLAKKLGLKAQNTEEGVNSLVEKIKELNANLNIPKSFKDAGIDEEEFLAKLDILADRAFEDQCTTANPKEPLISELKEIIEIAFDYKG